MSEQKERLETTTETSGALSDVASIRPLRIWKDVTASVLSELITMSVVELPPHGHVPEHRHVNEQVGLCIVGSLDFRVGTRRER
jgi:quercetin dioxygenase-like cupin family protein